jgi:hypothetical protein
MGSQPEAALHDLLDQVPSLDRSSQASQFHALLDGRAFSLGGQLTSLLTGVPALSWVRWATRNGEIAPASFARVSRGLAENVCT